MDQQPRAAVAQKRIALGKLSKDFDRLRSTLSAISMECSGIRASQNAENSFPRTVTEDDHNDRQKMHQLQLIQTLQGKDVDEAIQRERERDLRKINQDLAMVNEMFKCVLFLSLSVSLSLIKKCLTSLYFCSAMFQNAYSTVLITFASYLPNSFTCTSSLLISQMTCILSMTPSSIFQHYPLSMVIFVILFHR